MRTDLDGSPFALPTGWPCLRKATGSALAGAQVGSLVTSLGNVRHRMVGANLLVLDAHLTVSQIRFGYSTEEPPKYTFQAMWNNWNESSTQWSAFGRSRSFELDRWLNLVAVRQRA